MILVYSPVTDSAGVMQAVLSNVGLEVSRATTGAALRADVRGLVLVDSLVRQKAALIWKKHLANGACLL